MSLKTLCVEFSGIYGVFADCNPLISPSPHGGRGPVTFIDVEGKQYKTQRYSNYCIINY